MSTEQTRQKQGLIQLLRANGQEQRAQRGAPRFRINAAMWEELGGRLGKGLDLMGLWADAQDVHMALFAPDEKDFAIVSLAVEDGAFPSIGARHPAAIRLERAIQDLYGHGARGLPDGRPWLDHGAWPIRHPLNEKADAAQSGEEKDETQDYAFLPVEGEGVHEIPVGPVHAGIIEPGHFRFSCAGETVVRLEERLGYTHKGVERLMQGKPPAEAARIAARTCGDSTVAYSFAFARACEAALEVEVPPRAAWLRALMAELERLANHLGDTGAICNDAAFAFLHAHFGVLREDVLRAADTCFGHRLMMDCIVPGGVARDLDAEKGAHILQLLLDSLDERLEKLVEIYDTTASLQDRVRNTGRLSPALAQGFAAGGYVGRASGRAFDTRLSLPYPPYDSLAVKMHVMHKGDVNARVWVRIHEIRESIGLVRTIMHNMPPGDLTAELPGNTAQVREGVAVVEGFRGDVLAWLRLDEEGLVARCHLRDPSWFQWPLLEAVIYGNIVADFPLCNKSFNCSYSGHDL